MRTLRTPSSSDLGGAAGFFRQPTLSLRPSHCSPPPTPLRLPHCPSSHFIPSPFLFSSPSSPPSLLLSTTPLNTIFHHQSRSPRFHPRPLSSLLLPPTPHSASHHSHSFLPLPLPLRSRHSPIINLSHLPLLPFPSTTPLQISLPLTHSSLSPSQPPPTPIFLHSKTSYQHPHTSSPGVTLFVCFDYIINPGCIGIW